GCGAVWLARSLRMREDVGSNPAIPIGALLFGFWSEEIHRDVAQSGKRACSGCRRTSVRIRPSRSHGAPMFPSERGASGARPLWKRGAWVRVPPFRFSARGPTVGQWSVKPRRFGASGFDSRLAVLLRITARFAASGCSRNPARLVGLRLDSRLAVLLRIPARFAASGCSRNPARLVALRLASRLAVLLRRPARFAASGCSRNPAGLVGLRLDSRLAVLLRATARFAKRADVR